MGRGGTACALTMPKTEIRRFSVEKPRTNQPVPLERWKIVVVGAWEGVWFISHPERS